MIAHLMVNLSLLLVSLHGGGIHVCAGVHVVVCAPLCGIQRPTPSVIPQEPSRPLWFLRHGLSLVCSSMTRPGWLARTPLGSVRTTSPIPGLQVCLCALHMQTWVLGLAPPLTCCPVPTEPSPQPSCLFLCLE